MCVCVRERREDERDFISSYGSNHFMPCDIYLAQLRGNSEEGKITHSVSRADRTILVWDLRTFCPTHLHQAPAADLWHVVKWLVFLSWESPQICCTTNFKAKAFNPFQDSRIPHAQLNKFTQGEKIFRKGQMGKIKFACTEPSACRAEREKPEAGTHNNLLSMCIIFSVGKLK